MWTCSARFLGIQCGTKTGASIKKRKLYPDFFSQHFLSLPSIHCQGNVFLQIIPMPAFDKLEAAGCWTQTLLFMLLSLFSN